VVATAVGGTPEVVDDGVTGWLVAPRNVAAFAQRIGDLLANGGERQRMGEAGRKRIDKSSRSQGWPSSIERCSRAYEDAIPPLAT